MQGNLACAIIQTAFWWVASKTQVSRIYLLSVTQRPMNLQDSRLPKQNDYIN